MSLPKIRLDHETVDVAGELVDVSVLSRADAARFQKMVEDDVPKADLEIAVIAASLGVSEDETTEWYAATPAWAVEELMGHISRISRLDEGARKSSPPGDSPGGG